MSELSLPACPICHAPNSLSRETMERAGQAFTWYECQECGSVLLWMGDEQWAYQKVGREDKAYLLKRPMAFSELRGLLPAVEEVPAMPSTGEIPIDPRDGQPVKAPTGKERSRGKPTRLLAVAVGVIVIGFIGALVILMVALSPSHKATTTPQPMSQVAGTAAPTDTPTDLQQEVGTVEELESAIADAPEGASIVLAPATFVLEKPLEIRRSLKLVGAGMDQTEIVCDAEGYVMLFGSNGVFAAEDITFRHQGEAEADVVVVEGGEVAFSRCRFTGAVSPEQNPGRAGLVLKGNTSGIVRDCLAVENNTRGIRVADQTQATLEGNTCIGNKGLGIGFFDSAGGVARKNECSKNGGHGIQVAGQAQPVLEENTCTGNAQDGMAYFQNSGGVARQNECSGNLNGILVGGQAQPTLEDNVCTDNRNSGIAYGENGNGIARRNNSSNNATGIGVGGQAQPTLEENACADNNDAGIIYMEDGGGAARQNQLLRNGFGILVQGQAKPTLEGNTCTGKDLAGIGIFYMDASGGAARQNECSGNEMGIMVIGQAQPTLEENVCNDNKLGGIGYSENASGEARKNQCLRNQTGILVEGQARPTLEENVCNENLISAIRYAENSGGMAHQNDCSNNLFRGIEVGGQAQPTLEENVCNDNTFNGIIYGDNSGGVARANELLGNWIPIEIGGQAQPTLEANICTSDGIPGEKCQEENPDALTAALERSYQECVQSDSGVRYAISGSGVDKVSLTWQNDTGGTEQDDRSVPFCRQYHGFKSGDFLYISAQIVEPTDGAGSITCRIYDGASVIAEASAHGFASIATCNGSAR